MSQHRAQSTVTVEEEDAESTSENLADLASKLDQTHLDESHLDNNTTSEVQDFTSNKEKSGTPSPWAVFDAWGAGEGIAEPLSDEEELILSKESVMIPTTEEERALLPDESDILHTYDKLLKRKSSVHFGYPYNLMYNHEELYEFMKYSINNLGDPFITSNYGVHSRQFECSVVDFFAKLWNMQPDSYWGYVTTCGTEGNLHGILLARECHPDGILYSSKETHYSIFKAARYYRMDAKSIPTLPMGEIDYDALASEISKNRDRPVIINVNIGTTVKGAVDDLDRILRILKMLDIPRERYHIHCDGALFAMMMPFVDFAPIISFEKPIDSIAVSGHKMLGCPMPCGIALSRKEHVKKVEMRIDYLNSVDTTIMGSRNGQAALFLWYSLRKKGIAGIKRDVVHCMETARYLREKLTDAGFSCRVNDLSSTVVLERPMDDTFIKRWQLACEEDIAHVVVMPNVTRQKIDKFVEELIECKNTCGRMQPLRSDSPLSKLADSAWGGSAMTPVGNFTSDASLQ
jgi:histidine decarboxylase